MKHLFILIAIFISHSVFSQCYEDIKKLDTIYIPFREGGYNMKFDLGEDKGGFKNRSYIFNYRKKDAGSFNFEFLRNSSKIVESKEITIEQLQKYQNKIIEIDSVQKFDYQVVQCELFNRSKIFYIIDFSEKKGKNIKMYRVMFMRHCIVYE